MPAPLKKGALLTIELGSLANGGDAVGRTPEGVTVFVPRGAAGDTVDVELVEVHASYARARLIRVAKAGPARIAAPCPVAGTCGGCAWQHLDYQAQNEAKASFLLESFRRIGGLESPPLDGVLAPKDPYHYRNKAQVPVVAAPGGGLRLGYYREGTHDVVALPQEGCRILEPAVDKALCFVRDHVAELGLRPYDPRSEEGDLRHVVVRANSKGEAMAVLVTREPLNAEAAGKAAAWAGQAGIVSVQNNLQRKAGNVIMGDETLVLAGPAILKEELDACSFRLSATSFFQVNPSQTSALLGVLKGIRPWKAGEQVLELYCGVGTLSLPLGKLGLRLHGVESHGAAVEDARANALANGLPELSFSVAGAAQAWTTLPAGFKPQVLVVDPPRKGLDPAVIKALSLAPVPELVYVSCDPANLARDVKALAALGYALQRSQGVDLFPQTAHVESVNWLKRQG